jgi:hypothetical protein
MKPGSITTCALLLLMATDVVGGLSPAPLGESLLHYTGLGFQHIIPNGLDHVCFVLGLFFVSRNVMSLVWQVTAFTLAHSLTFGLTLCGLVELPERAVEIAVALSITFIAAENLWSAELTRWRPWVVFGFGLMHGLAFAHTFQEHSVPLDHFTPALFAFNMGIEMGQLAVIMLALTFFGVFWRKPWYRRAVAIPASAVIAIVGAFMVVARLVG